MVVVPLVVTPQRPIALVRICPHGRGPFKIGVVSDEGEQPVVGDVERGEWGRFPFLGGAFDPCSGFLFVRVGFLWQR